MIIGVIVALDGEFEQMKKLLGGRTEGRLGNNEIILHKSGIGKVNAALEAVSLIDGYPLDCLISTGVAGGLDPSLKCLDMVAASEVVYHDVWCGEGNEYGQVQGFPARFKSNAVLYCKALETGARGGLVCSGDRFVNTSGEARAILDHFPEGIAVDMESGAIAQTCFVHDVPFLSIRIISDVAGENHQSDYDNFWESLADGSFEAIRRFLLSLPGEL